MIEEFHPCYSLSFCATHCTNTVELSAMLVLHEKIIRQFHLVYHIHHGEENSRQNGGYESHSAGRCPCRHRRTWGRFRRRESCVGSAQAVRVNPIGSLIGSVGIFHFVPLGHIWPTNLEYDVAK